MEDLPTNQSGSDAAFAIGQFVYFKADPSIRGPVVSSMLGTPENRFGVHINGKIRTYYASQLKAAAPPENKHQLLHCDDLHAYLTALQIQYPRLSTLYSLHTARIDFIPYQYRPVLRFIRSERSRLLIADSVGVGKTIEAGLILQELQARREIKSVLIICPSPLVKEHKWAKEMKRFGVDFEELDGKKLKFCINETNLDGEWPEKYQRIIVPYSLLDEALLTGVYKKQSNTKGLRQLEPPPRFDLVIVDEAHHIRNTNTSRHKAVRFFCDNAEAAIFLSATPIQLGSHDLFVLLNTLCEDLVPDEATFGHMSEPNPSINKAVALVRGQQSGWPAQAKVALDNAAATPWGQSFLKHDPEFNRISAQLTKAHISPEERVQLITDIEALHTFSEIINRTRRRDIGEFTVRKTEPVVVAFTPHQEELYNDLLHIQAEIFRSLHGNVYVNFLMTTIRRRAASCLLGLVPYLEGILSRRLDELQGEDADDDSEVVLSANSVDIIKSDIQAILEKARALDPYDPKLDALREIIRNKQKQPNNKVMLFSCFKHTLRYLYKHLKEDGFRVGMVSGDTPEEERNELREYFELPANEADCLDVLLFSEVGSEGLDYQFCDCIVNYDLPWNPMRIEQRIGRIDRYGQQSKSVSIVNLITPGTVDADIYERCLMRIGIFESALGGGEEILGEITSEIRDIASNPSLTETERGEQLQQLADNKIRLIQEQDRLEQEQLDLFGTRLPQDQMTQEIEQASNYWLHPTSIEKLVVSYLQNTCGENQEFILGEKALKTLRLSKEARKRLLEDFEKISRINNAAYQEWGKWLKGEDQHFSVTFNVTCASQNRKIAFLTPFHPLVIQASAAFDTQKRGIAILRSKSNDIPEGSYDFIIHQWQFHGLREGLRLQPIASTDAVTEHLASLLQTAENEPVTEGDIPGQEIWERLEGQHHKMRSAELAQHLLKTQEQVDYKKKSLTRSHKGRLNRLEAQLKQATDENIQTMRRSQIDKEKDAYSKRIQELDSAVEKSEITTEQVAYGVIHITKGEPHVN